MNLKPHNEPFESVGQVLSLLLSPSAATRYARVCARLSGKPGLVFCLMPEAH